MTVVVKKDYPLVSVVIINWNGSKWLRKCLTTILDQSYMNTEVVVVDNGSTDDSIDVIKSFRDVKVIKNSKNLGFAGGCNKGIDIAKGEEILLLNNDTWVSSDFLEALYKEKKVRALDVISPRELNYANNDSNNKPTSFYSTTIDILGHPVQRVKSNSKNLYLTGVCLMFKKAFYIETAGLDNNFFMYCEEIDWFWRLCLMEKSFDYSRSVCIYHAMGGSTTKGLNQNVFLWRNQNTLQMILKNYKLHTLIFILPLYLLQNIFEIISFCVVLKPRIARTYIEGILFNAKNIHKTMYSRKIVQKNRIVGDYRIFRLMYPGLGKLYHLVHYHRTS